MKLNKRIGFVLCCFQFFHLGLHAQNASEKGCIDPFSRNFNPEAVLNDGSYRFGKTSYSPRLLSELPDEVDETSGLFFYKGKLWTHNDSGGKPILYAIDTATYQVAQKIHLSNAKSIDWEEIAIDDTHVYVGDFGNNYGTRKDLCIYKFPLAAIPCCGDTTITAEKINFQYSDQINFDRRRGNNFDCEAMIVTENFIYLFSKNWQDAQSRLYRLSKEAGSHQAEIIGSFDADGLITATDYDIENRKLVLLGYVNWIWKPFMYVIYDIENENFLTAPRRRIELTKLITTQVEGICFINRNTLLMSSESSKTHKQRLFEVAIEKWTDRFYLTKDKKANNISFIEQIKNERDTLSILVSADRLKKKAYRFELLNAKAQVLYSEVVDFSSENAHWIHIPKTKNMENELWVLLLGNKKRYRTKITQNENE